MKNRAPSSTVPAPESIRESSGMDSDIRHAFGKANSEMEAIFQQGIVLETQGKLDAAETARIEAQLQEISTKLEKDLADHVSQINARYAAPKRWLLPRPYRVPAIVAMVFLSSGTLLETTIGTSFIFSGSNIYRSVMPWLFGALIPIFAVGWFLLERANHGLRAQSPTWFIRWFVLFPGVVTLSAAMVVFSPLGWAALLGWGIGSPTNRVEVRVISVNHPSRSSRGCDQYAHLEFEGTGSRICLEGRLSGPAPQAGEMALVSGRMSRLGLFIEQIDHR